MILQINDKVVSMKVLSTRTEHIQNNVYKMSIKLEDINGDVYIYNGNEKMKEHYDQILQIIGIDNWHDFFGRQVDVKVDNNSGIIYAIGSLDKDEWVF